MLKTNNTPSKIHPNKLCAAFLLASSLMIPAVYAQSSDEDWKAHTISPVANPIYFEDPQITSEARPIFMDHFLPGTFHFKGGSVPLGGDIQVFALQLRYALTDRLALIATKDGYIESRPDHTLAHTYGWGNISAGAKYALIDDKKDNFILTPGLTIELPTGNENVFQGRGAGLWNGFVSAEKGWQKFHITGNLGFLIPDDFSQQTAQAHYSLQLDYEVCKYFIPFVVGNGYTVLSDGDHNHVAGVPLTTELYDLSDLGSTAASGRTQMTVGAGFRTHVLKKVDVGFAYEFGATSPQGIFSQRVTVDAIWRF
jgi:hypothetical protein